MIFGTGIDIIDVARIGRVHSRWGEKFLNKFLRPDEIKYCQQQADPSPSIAARFAGKEAVSKAFGTGIGEKLNWHDLEIVHHERGRPMVRLHGKAKVLLMELGGKDVTSALATAMVKPQPWPCSKGNYASCNAAITCRNILSTNC